MFYVYILKSSKFNRLYIGVTENLQRRFNEHNKGKVKSTKAYIPYDIFKTEQYESKTAALKREIQIKKSGLLRKLIKNHGAIV
jgi:putative endonuclease